MIRLPLLIVLAGCALGAKSAAPWTQLRNAHFEVDSQSGTVAAQETLRWFERMRGFFQEHGLLPEAPDCGRLKIVCFRSQSDYAEYRPRSSADAAYFAVADGEFILIAPMERSNFAVAAHEYTHYVLHANSLSLPAWLNEGLAEFFSTLTLTSSDYQLGGDLPARSRTLKQLPWLPISQLLQITDSASVPNSRTDADIFYAESWALTDMLLTSNAYRAGFPRLIAELSSGADSAPALQEIYHQSAADLTRQLQQWTVRPSSTRGMLLKHPETPPTTISELTQLQSLELLAQLARVTGHTEKAQTRYLDLLRQQPGNPDYLAALGVISLELGNRPEARSYWREAIDKGTTDATLCYRYAVLAEEAGLGIDVRKAALERAIALAPRFDDALFQLAIVDNQLADYQSAVRHLKAMHVPQGSRRYGYWSTLADAFTELDQRSEAAYAAQQALACAQNENDRQQARRTAYIAATDLTVQFETGSDGQRRMVTTRVPHGTRNFNPFIEPSDNIQQVTAPLSAVLCDNGKFTGFLMNAPAGPITLQVPDPLHVLIRNGPAEFYCGPAAASQVVTAEFAVVRENSRATNLLRGMDFKPLGAPSSP